MWRVRGTRKNKKDVYANTFGKLLVILTLTKGAQLVGFLQSGSGTRGRSTVLSCTQDVRLFLEGQKPKIFHVTKETEFLAPYGGVSRVVHELATTQLARFNVFVVLPKYGFISKARKLCEISVRLKGTTRKLDIKAHVEYARGINYVLISPPRACPTLWSSVAREEMYTVPRSCRILGFDKQARDLYFTFAATAFFQSTMLRSMEKTNVRTPQRANERVIFHVHSSHNAPFVYFAMQNGAVTWGSRVRYIYTLHDYDGEMKTTYKKSDVLRLAHSLRHTEDIPMSKVGCMAKQHRQFIEKRNLHAFELAMCANAITSVSQGMLNYLETNSQATDALVREYLEARRVQVIQNWISPSVFKTATNSINPHSPMESKIRAKSVFFSHFLTEARADQAHTCALLWVGRFDTNKGIHALSTIHAAACRRRCIFTIMGYHTTNGKDKRLLRRQIAHIRRTEHIGSCPLILLDNSDKQAKFGSLARAAADVVVITSAREAYGLVAAESLAYASIPIVPNIGGLIDVVRPHGTRSNNWTGIVYNHSIDHEKMLDQIDYAIDTCLDLLDTAWMSRGVYTQLLKRLQESTPTQENGRQAYDKVIDELLR